MYKYLILLFLFLTACGPELTEEDIRQQEYGDFYATMTCWWSSNQTPPTPIFWCDENLEAELISGHVSMAVEKDIEGNNYFSICGKNVNLNSGHTLHDTLIASMTLGVYNCYDSYERELGNEFDWIWDEESSTLQLIWRPKEELHKVLTLFIPPEMDSPRVLGTVYYKTGTFN